MKKYDSFVYFTICETTIHMVKKTNYSTYRGYCRGIARAIDMEYLSGTELSDINQLHRILTLYFGMSYNENKKYIENYFLLDLWKEYELSVRLTFDYFPHSFN